MKKKYLFLPFIIFLILFSGCRETKTTDLKTINFGDYSLARLRLSYPENLSPSEKKTVDYLIQAAAYADSIFLLQSAGNFSHLRNRLKGKDLLRFNINFGPWDRFLNNQPFVENVPPKPQGAFFYPLNMVKQEFEQYSDSCKYSNFTVLRRDQNGNLYCIPYRVFYRNYLDSAIKYLKKAAEATNDTSLKSYLKILITSLKTDNYYPMYRNFIKLNSRVEFVFGPVSISEDRLFNIKADYQSYVLIKIDSLSKKFNQYVQWLKYLQKALPVPEQYRREDPGANSIISVYQAVYLGGSARAGAPIIATTLPFNPKFQTNEGTKNLQFINIIDAKYKGIMQPLADIVLINSQQKYVTNNAFRNITLLYEIGNSLGIRNTINGKGSVRNALKEYYTVTENIKNYLMVLFLAEKLYSVGELSGDIKEYYYTFIVNLVRGIRWGIEDDFGLANLMILNYLEKKQAINFLPSSEIIIHYPQMKKSVENLLSNILILQGNGDYINTAKFILTNKYLSVNLQNLLQKIKENKIPSDIYFQQIK